MICYHQFMTDDSNRPATKADVHGVRGELYAVRDDLKGDIQRLAVEIVKTHTRMDQMEERLNSKMDVGFSRIMNSIDAFAGEAKHYRQADISRGHALIEAEIKIKDHEKRIKALESVRS